MPSDEIVPYQAEKKHAYATGEAKYLEDNRVKPGKMIRITHLAGTFENAATTEYIVLGYWNGHAYIELKKVKPAVASDLVHWDGEIWLREGQYAYMYAADVANGEAMQLRVEGRWE